MKKPSWTSAGPKTWTKGEILVVLKDAQFGDRFTELNHLSATRFVRIGWQQGMRLTQTNEGNMLNAGVRFVITVVGRA